MTSGTGVSPTKDFRFFGEPEVLLEFLPINL